MAIERACALLDKYAYGKVLSGVIEYNTLDRKDKTISSSFS